MAKKEKSENKKEKVVAEEKPKKVKTEKKVTKEQPISNIRLYSLEELANLYGLTLPQMRSLYLRRGLDVKTKLSYEEAYKKFNTIA